MTVGQLLRFTRRTHPRWNERRFRQLLEYFRITEQQRIRSLSNGQRGQVSLAVALAGDPELLVLDDPTLGLDAGTRRDFLRSIVRLQV